MGLIGRDYDLGGQILKIVRMKEKVKKRGEYSVKGIADGQRYGKNTKKKEGKLTLGTTKLTAIAPRRRRLKTWGLLEEVLAGVLRALEQCHRQESRVGAVE
jgi:hypothetical protein